MPWVTEAVLVVVAVYVKERNTIPYVLYITQALVLVPEAWQATASKFLACI